MVQSIFLGFEARLELLIGQDSVPRVSRISTTPSGSWTCWGSGLHERADAPPRQDAPRRLSLSSAGGRMPSGYGQRHVQLPRLLPYLGQVKEGGERGEASDGQRPVRAGAGGGKRLVPTQSASILARSACPSVPDVARPLCLLRHIGQLSTHTMVRLPGRGAGFRAGSASSA